MGTAEDDSSHRRTFDGGPGGVPPHDGRRWTHLRAPSRDRDVVFETSRVAATSEDVIEYHVDVTEREVRRCRSARVPTRRPPMGCVKSSPRPWRT